jgi:shikimate kinase
MKDRVVLVGFRGTGKSTVGRLLAQELHWPWRDSDQELERQSGQTISACFEQHGEAWFRAAEERVIEQLWSQVPCVLSLGGGAILSPLTRMRLKRDALVVWLRASPLTIEQRMQDDPHTATQRPALSQLDASEEIRVLLQAREPLYADVSLLNYTTDDMEPNSIVRDLVLRFGGELFRQP